MIQLVIQKEFLEYITNTFNLDNKVHYDFRMFLECTASPLTVYTDCDANEFKMFQLNGKLNPLIRLLCNSKYPTVKSFNSLDEILNETFFNDGFAYKMLFIDSDASTCTKLKTQFGFEFFCEENFEKEWMKYYSGNDRLELGMSVDKKGFNDWALLKSIRHPVLSAIVVDPFLLADKQLIKTNINKIIEQLISLEIINKVKEIILITTDDQKELSNSAWQERFQIISKIQETFKGVEVYLFRYPKNIPDHARGIFTNYWYIYSGNSFKYFDDKGQLKKVNDNISFQMNFYKKTINQIASRLKDAEEYVLKSLDDTISIGVQEKKQRRFTTKPIAADYLPSIIKTIKSFQ